MIFQLRPTLVLDVLTGGDAVGDVQVPLRAGARQYYYYYDQ